VMQSEFRECEFMNGKWDPDQVGVRECESPKQQVGPSNGSEFVNQNSPIPPCTWMRNIANHESRMNKSLNIFNSRLVLASPQTATDADYAAILGVIGHEYFHNWADNRVTCRDWFQLSLKEGITIFRDQEFSSDMGSRAVKRIADVVKLHNYQFPRST